MDFLKADRTCNMSHVSRTRIFVFIAGLLFSHSNFARAQAAQRWTVAGSLRLRFEDWDFFKAPPADSSYGYGASVLRVSVGRQFRTQDWLFELEQPSLIGLPSQAVA